MMTSTKNLMLAATATILLLGTTAPSMASGRAARCTTALARIDAREARCETKCAQDTAAADSCAQQCNDLAAARFERRLARPGCDEQRMALAAPALAGGGSGGGLG